MQMKTVNIPKTPQNRDFRETRRSIKPIETKMHIKMYINRDPKQDELKI